MTMLAMQYGFEYVQDMAPSHIQSLKSVGFAVPQSAPWVCRALSDLWNIEQNGAELKGFGDFRVAAETGIRVRKLLSRIGNMPDVPIPIVSSFSGGGISLIWELGNRRLKYTFWPEGVLTYSQEENEQTINEDELPTDQGFNAREPMQWLISSHG